MAPPLYYSSESKIESRLCAPGFTFVDRLSKLDIRYLTASAGAVKTSYKHNLTCNHSTAENVPTVSIGEDISYIKSGFTGA